MRCEARHSPEAEHTVWWLLLCRAVERAARAAAFREAARVASDAGLLKMADALRARADSGGER